MTSLIFLTTTTNASVLADGIIPLTTISRRKGCAVQEAINGASLNKPGYYSINASITFTAGETGDVTVVLQKNGVDVPGITATETVGTATTEVHTINLTGTVRVYCNEIAVINLVNTGIAIDVSNVSLKVEYLN